MKLASIQMETANFYRSAWTLFVKEMKRFLDVWSQTVVAPIVSNLLFFVVFGSLFAARAGEGGADAYFGILVPGLAAMGLMMNSFGNPLGSIMIAKYSNSIRELLMYPMKGRHVVVAFIAAAFVRGMVVAGVTVGVGMLFAKIPFAAVWWIAIFSVLISVIFASLGIITAIYSKTFDQSSMVQNFLLQPLIYLGGVFYAVDSLPETAQVISQYNPIFYMIEGFRYGFTGTGSVSIWLSLAVTASIAAVLYGIASWIFQSGHKLRT